MSRNSGPNVFQRGVMALILLSLLRREDMYGYQLVQEIERCSGGQQGLISDRKVLVGKRMTRVYYHLEPAGEDRLDEMAQEFESMMTGVLAIIREEVPSCNKKNGKSTDMSEPSPVICPALENKKSSY